jgi:hypothetical protein
VTPDEIQTLHFLRQALLWGFAVVFGLVLPWAASARTLRVPKVEVGRWESHRGGEKGGSEGGKRGRKLKPGRHGRGGKSTLSGPRSTTPVTECRPDLNVLVQVPDRDADDAIAACRVLGFGKREAEECVRELRVGMPDAVCGDLVRRALGRLGKGCA